MGPLAILAAGAWMMAAAPGVEVPAVAVLEALPLAIPEACLSPTLACGRRQGSPLPKGILDDGAQPLPLPLVPSGVRNLALHAPVSSSDAHPAIGALAMITDGDKAASSGSFVELAPGPQWVQVDLTSVKELWAVALWHFHAQERIYQAVVIQVADDALCTEQVRTLFNNDAANAVGQGRGADHPYPDTHRGRVIPCGGTWARCVRLWSRGNDQDDGNHYVEVEVWGR